MPAASRTMPGPVIADVVLRERLDDAVPPAARADADALLTFFRGLSERSLYLRFHGHPSVDERLVDPVLEPDWVEHGALIGTAHGRVVAVTNYVRLRDPHSAEVAFAVADDYQGRGIGLACWSSSPRSPGPLASTSSSPR